MGLESQKGSKSDFEHWVSEFNLLCEKITIDKYSYEDSVEFIDLFIYRGENFAETGKFDMFIFQKKDNKYMYQQKVALQNIPLKIS